jgi:hypothetical protein
MTRVSVMLDMMLDTYLQYYCIYSKYATSVQVLGYKEYFLV